MTSRHNTEHQGFSSILNVKVGDETWALNKLTHAIQFEPDSLVTMLNEIERLPQEEASQALNPKKQASITPLML